MKVPAVRAFYDIIGSFYFFIFVKNVLLRFIFFRNLYLTDV